MPSDTRLQQHHRRGLSLSCAIANDKDDDLVLFRDMQRKEQELKLSAPKLVGCKKPFTPLRRSDQQTPCRMSTMPRPVKSGGADDILASDQNKNDYDWLMTPPSTPVFLNGDHNLGLPRMDPTTVMSTPRPSKIGDLKSDLPLQAESSSISASENLGSNLPLKESSAGLATGLTKASNSVLSLSRKPSAARPPTHSSVHLSKLAPPGLIASKVSTSQLSAKSSAASVANGVSHTLTSASHSLSRPTTPVKRLSSPGHPCNPPSALVRCSSANRASSIIEKGPLMSCRSSASTRAWSPESFSGPPEKSIPNRRTSAPEKTQSVSKGNKTSQADMLETKIIHNRWKPGSPLVTKVPTTTAFLNGGKELQRTSNLDDKLAARKGKVDEQTLGVSSAKVFGKEQKGSLANQIVRKPLKANSLKDMKAIISSVRGSVPKKSSELSAKQDNNRSASSKFRSFMSNMAKSTLISRKLGINGTNSARRVLDSPMATSSTASSEQNMSIIIDPDGSELGDECISDERASRSSSASQHDLVLGKENRIHSWLRSPAYKDDDADIMQIFEQEGLGSLSGPESPLITELEGTIECDNFSLDPVL